MYSPDYARVKKYSSKTILFSLQSLCFDAVVQNFELYYYALARSKDARLQRNMEFLQRRFSHDLASELLITKKKDAYFRFLINEHITVVYFNWFRGTRYWTAVDDIICRIPNLLKITLCDFADDVLESIAKFCPKIIEINATNARASDKGVKYLCELKNGRLPCPELKNVYLTSCYVTDKGIECLIRNLPSIEILEYEKLPTLLHSIYSKRTRRSKMPPLNLTELNLGQFTDVPNYTEVLKSCLIVCPKLESIFCELSEEVLNTLTDSHFCWKKIHLYSYDKPYINIDNFLKDSGRNLIILDISHCSMSASLLAVHCPFLKEFVGRDVDFTDDNDNLQTPFLSLTSCVLSTENPTFVKAFSLFASSSPNLDTVSLQSYVFSDKLITSDLKDHILMWCKNPSAKCIRLQSFDVEIDFLKDILQVSSLKWVDLLYCRYDGRIPREILNFSIKNHNRLVINFYPDYSRTFVN